MILYLDTFSEMYCCHAVVSEDAKTTLASSLQTLPLDRESNTVSRCVRPCIKLTPEYLFKGINYENCVTLQCNVMSQGHGINDEAFQELSFLWESEASIGADFDLFDFQVIFHEQESI